MSMSDGRLEYEAGDCGDEGMTKGDSAFLLA